jgi:hypothetical protein
MLGQALLGVSLDRHPRAAVGVDPHFSLSSL